MIEVREYPTAARGKFMLASGRVRYAGVVWDICTAVSRAAPDDPLRVGLPDESEASKLAHSEFKALVGQLGEPHRTMVIVAGCLGLRVSEMLGLKWGDLDFLNLTVRIQRSVVEGEVNETKTEASASALPLDRASVEVLTAHRMRSSYREDSGFVFAGAHGRPPWPDGLLTDHLKPAAVRAGVGVMGWHTLRHSYSTLLRSLGADVKVQQALLRHADVATTLNVYTQAVPAALRETASKAVEALWKN